MTRIAVIGAGAIGGTIAAWLAQNPQHQVTLCVRTPVDALTIETPSGTIHATPTILTDPVQAGPVDWVLSTTKAYDSVGAAKWLAGLMGPDTHVAVLQNGVEHRERFRGVVPDDRIVPAIVDIPAERSAPGHILQRRHGWIKVPDGASGAGFAALFAHTPIEVTQTDALVTVAWRKLAINCAGIVNAITMRPAEVTNDPAVAEVMRDLVRECCAIGRAEGADMPESVVDSVIDTYRNADPQSLNSIHADRIAGRQMELDARNGVIVRLGEKHGIATPINRALAAMLAASA